MSDYKFEPFQPVLVRVAGVWTADFFSYLINYGEDLAGDKHTGYATASGRSFEFYNILPYDDDTKHLLGTKDEPKPKWKPKPGELVAVRGSDEGEWKVRVFDHFNYKDFAVCHAEFDSTILEHWLYCEPLHKHFNVPEEA